MCKAAIFPGRCRCEAPRTDSGASPLMHQLRQLTCVQPPASHALGRPDLSAAWPLRIP